MDLDNSMSSVDDLGILTKIREEDENIDDSSSGKSQGDNCSKNKQNLKYLNKKQINLEDIAISYTNVVESPIKSAEFNNKEGYKYKLHKMLNRGASEI